MGRSTRPHFYPQNWPLCHMGLYSFEFEFESKSKAIEGNCITQGGLDS